MEPVRATCMPAADVLTSFGVCSSALWIRLFCIKYRNSPGFTYLPFVLDRFASLSITLSYHFGTEASLNYSWAVNPSRVWFNCAWIGWWCDDMGSSLNYTSQMVTLRRVSCSARDQYSYLYFVQYFSMRMWFCIAKIRQKLYDLNRNSFFNQCS